VVVNVSGLAGPGLVLRNNGGDDLTINQDGLQAFATRLASGAGYAVTVKTLPPSPSEFCTVNGGAGTIASADVTVQVTCSTNAYHITGSVSGLNGSGLVLENNGGDDVAINKTGPFGFTFATPIASGASYAVTVKTPPTVLSQTCTSSPASGTVGNADVQVTVTCATNSFRVGGTVTGVRNSGLVLENNLTDDTTVAPGATTFTMTTSAVSGAPYGVTVKTPATNETCTVSSDTGTVTNADVTSVAVSCCINFGQACDLSGGNICCNPQSGITCVGAIGASVGACNVPG
jgi:hypothetical protein